jgi:prepilin-type N-terminal cleavage/methylation domain-containing protein
MRHTWVSPTVMRGLSPAQRPSAQEGFTIIEVMVAMFILVIGVLGALTMINASNLTSLSNKARTGGVNLARQIQEGSKGVLASVTYDHLSDGCPASADVSNPCPETSAIVTALQTQPGLAADGSSPAGVWQITREDVAYQVKVAVCSMDDPTDGYGSHASGGPYCSDSTAGSTDSQADDYKRVTIGVSWDGTRGTQNVRTVALIQSSGVNGPGVTCLRQTGSSCPNAPVITSPSTTSLSFTATIQGSATTLEWFVNSNFQGTATPSGTTATFSWNLGTVGSASQVYDGTYEVSAIAYDGNGKAGTVGTVEVTLNRSAPSMPGSFFGGRDIELTGNGTIGGVDLDWLPVSDQDILYYRVYSRVGTGTPVLEYQTPDASTSDWFDLTVAANPNSWGGGNCAGPPVDPSPVYYYVVAVDQNGSTPREGTPTASADVNGCNHKPKNVGGLNVAGNADGTATVTWSQPGSPVDPDSGDNIIGYRIYRWPSSVSASVDPTDRYAYVLGLSTLSYTDLSPQPGGAQQSYCVRAVDTHMQESDNCSGKKNF